ncbi:MAG: beta-lactamase family protein [Desulfobacterales bacterium]|nr:beta-lactamase family protein [Desulfobacterales bacterium]
MIKKIILGFLGGIVLLFVIICGYLYSLKVERPDGRIAVLSALHHEKYQASVPRAEEWVSSIYSLHLLPSLSVAVGIDGDLVWEGVIGYSNIRDQVMADHKTGYRIGSISKSMTASAVLQMHQKGILQIDRPFNTYVKDYAPGKAGYTIKQLLNHQAGIRHYAGYFTEAFNTREYHSTREAASIVENDDLLFTPGTGFNYSTYGYTLIALAMESASASSFEKIMADTLFLPMGMKSTHFDKINTREETGQATPYISIDDFFFTPPKENVSYKYAGGGLVSTPSDMVKFGNSLLNDDFLNAESRTVLWQPVPLKTGGMNPQNYALGFRTGRDEFGMFAHHGGSLTGGYSFLIVYPEIGVVVAFSTNTRPAGFNRLEAAKEMVGIFTKVRN